MANLKLLWNNLADAEDTVLTASSEDSDYPATNIQHRWKSLCWHSSGNIIIDGNNKYIDYNEGGASSSVTLTEGTYTPADLASHIQTVLDGDATATITAAYSTTTFKYTIESDGATFELEWKTGTHGSDNTDNHVGTTIGFDDSADDTGDTSYTSDNVAIHTSEWLKFDLGSALTVKTLVIVNHNIGTTGSTLKLQGHTSDAWAGPDVDESLTITEDKILHLDTTGWSKRWWRIYIEDTDNSSGYVRIGRVYLGSYFEFTNNYRKKTLVFIDPSDKKYSTGGQISTNPKNKYKVISYYFDMITRTDKNSLLDVFDEVGTSENYFIVEDHADSDPEKFTYYCQNTSDWEFKTSQIGSGYFNLDINIETLR